MEQPPRKNIISVIAISLVVGIVGLTTVAGRPRFSGYATVDVLQLLASGMCFGIAFAGIVRSFRNSSIR
jgi:hypothetical protein